MVSFQSQEYYFYVRKFLYPHLFEKIELGRQSMKPPVKV